MRARAAIALAAAVVAALLASYAALGGGRYEPPRVADPCELRPSLRDWTLDAATQQLALGLLARAACELGVTREELALALVNEKARERLLQRYGLDERAIVRLLNAGERR
jgi:hypothetical protein